MNSQIWKWYTFSEAPVGRCSVKKVILQNSQENTCTRVLNKVASLPLVSFHAPWKYLMFSRGIERDQWQACNCIKKDSGTRVSCEFFKILNNTCFYRTPHVAASCFWNFLARFQFCRRLFLTTLMFVDLLWFFGEWKYKIKNAHLNYTWMEIGL